MCYLQYDKICIICLSSGGYIWVRNDTQFIGSNYRKAVFREYTDATFLFPKPHEDHLGVMGPFIKAEVGDIIEIDFFNTASRPYSMHPHGVFADKSNEGALYLDGTSLKADDAVQPGAVYRYRWLVPERAGPGKNDPNCIPWIYQSSTDPEKDVNSGLFGPLITCRKNILDNQNKRTDVNKEFATTFAILNETNSWYLNYNIRNHAPLRTNLTDPTFQLSNAMNAINGYIFGNLPGLVMTSHDIVAWYIMGIGSQFINSHTAHFHGQTVLKSAETSALHRADVIEISPGTFEVVEMLADNPGTWLFHCHVGLHALGGMEALYTVLPKKNDVFG